eukprot:4514603-Karenia_brevis.AAC.1
MGPVPSTPAQAAAARNGGQAAETADTEAPPGSGAGIAAKVRAAAADLLENPTGKVVRILEGGVEIGLHYTT